MLNTSAPASLPPDAASVLAWLRANYFGGRSPIYSVLEVARGVFPRMEGPAPGTTFEPIEWGRVRCGLDELVQRGLAEHGRLPQGDFGFRLTPAGLPR